MEHLSTIVVLAIIAAYLAVVIRGILRKKAGKSGCGCSCDSCAGKSLCHREEQE